MQLQEWIDNNIPDEKMYWRQPFERQVCFLRDAVPNALGMSYEETTSMRVWVIGDHVSKSIKLPVVCYSTNDARMIIRGNFHNYMASVDSDKTLNIDPRGLFTPHGAHSACYCEGFPDDLVFGSYASDQRRFTVSLPFEHAVWAFARAVRLALLDA